MTPEGKVKDIIKKGLDEMHIFPFEKALACSKRGDGYSGYYMMPSTNGIGEAGMSDFLICMRGHYIEVETKAKNGKPSGIQIAHAEVIGDAGGQANFVTGEEEAHLFIKYLSQELLILLKAERMAHQVREMVEKKEAMFNKPNDPGEMH